MAHDVYSLGVCMLEILRWESLLRPGPASSVSEAFVSAFESLNLAPNLEDAADSYTKFPRNNKAVLLSMNETHIPTEAGTKMSHIVCGFLTCLDEGGNEYVPANEEDRRKVAMQFADTALVDTALTDLRKIPCLI